MMASARARLMTAVDLTLTVQGDDPDAPIVHKVQGPDDEDEAKDIVDCAVKDGLMAMPDAEDMEGMPRRRCKGRAGQDD